LARTIIYAIRHADVANPKKLLYGHLPGFHLSEKGKKQAEYLGKHLSSAEIREIVHSPLERAKETAEIVAAQFNSPVPLKEDVRLTEAYFSKYLQGVPFRQIPIRRPLWWIHMVKRGILPNDESVDQMASRVFEVILELKQRNYGKAAALVSHADPLAALWAKLNNKKRMIRYDAYPGRACYYKLVFDDDVLSSIEYVNPFKQEMLDNEPDKQLRTSSR